RRARAGRAARRQRSLQLGSDRPAAGPLARGGAGALQRRRAHSRLAGLAGPAVLRAPPRAVVARLGRLRATAIEEANGGAACAGSPQARERKRRRVDDLPGLAAVARPAEEPRLRAAERGAAPRVPED